MVTHASPDSDMSTVYFSVSLMINDKKKIIKTKKFIEFFFIDPNFWEVKFSIKQVLTMALLVFKKNSIRSNLRQKG